MDIAVLSDIHSNHSAFQACFDYAVGKGITNFVLLGDYITDAPYPQKTMELIYVIRKYFNCWMVRGNREEYLLNYVKNGRQCQTAHCGRCEQHFIVGAFTSPTVRFGR